MNLDKIVQNARDLFVINAHPLPFPHKPIQNILCNLTKLHFLKSILILAKKYFRSVCENKLNNRRNKFLKA